MDEVVMEAVSWNSGVIQGETWQLAERLRSCTLCKQCRQLMMGSKRLIKGQKLTSSLVPQRVNDSFVL